MKFVHFIIFRLPSPYFRLPLTFEAFFVYVEVLLSAIEVLFATTLVLKAAAMHLWAPGKQQNDATVHTFIASVLLKTRWKVTEGSRLRQRSTAAIKKARLA